MEIHAMFNCEAYNDIRNLYIDRDALTCANDCNFIKLMNADIDNTVSIAKLAKFVSCMFKIRQHVWQLAAMSALCLYDGLEALCTMNEIKTWNLN